MTDETPGFLQTPDDLMSSQVSSMSPEDALRRQLAAEYVARQDARAHLRNFMVYSGIAHPDLPRHARHICDRIEHMFSDAPDAPQIMVVCQPPGTLKTTVARGVVAWRLALDDATRAIWATHRSDHALKQSRMILELLRSPRFHALSATRLSEQSQSAATFETTHAPEPGGMVSLGSGSGARGYRADLIVLDDPAGSVQDAASGTVADTLVDWYERDLVSRLMPGGKILVFAQRLAERDLPGYLMRRYGGDPDVRIEVITLQMRATADLPCPLGRNPGELLWPDFFDGPTCRMLEAESLRWQAEYQQDPPSMTGGQWCMPGDIEIVDRAPEGLRLLSGSDLALGQSRGRGDYSVHLVAGLGADRRLYFVDAWRSRDCDTLEAGNALLDLCLRYSPRYSLHEDTVIERSIMPALKERARLRNIPFNPHAVPTAGVDKVARAEALQSMRRPPAFSSARL